MPRHPDAVIIPNTLISDSRLRMASPLRPGQRMSRPELADAVNAALDRLYPGRDLTAHYVDFRWIGKLERGETRWPSDQRRAALRHVLGAATDTEIGLYIQRRSDRVYEEPLHGPLGGTVLRPSQLAPGPIRPIPTAEYAGVERAIVAAAHECSDHAREAGMWAVQAQEINQLHDAVRDVARRFDALTPAEVVQMTLRVRNVGVDLLPRTRRPAQLNDLYLVVAQAVSLLASASIDLGLWGTAQQYAETAEQYGEIIDHAGVRAYAFGLQATVAYWTDRPAEAVRLADMAAEQAPNGIARARALSILARAWSHRGSADELRRALAAADDARSVEGSDELHDLVGGEFGYTLPQQARSASTAWIQVGLTHEATTAAQAALNALANTAPWSTVEAEARVDLATCHLLAGDADAARESLAPLWSMPSDWRRAGLLGRLHRVQTVLSADHWKPVLAARDIAEETALFVATAAGPPELPPA